MKSSSIRRNTLTLCLAALPAVACFSADDPSGSGETETSSENETGGQTPSSSDPTADPTADPTSDPTSDPSDPSTTGMTTSDESTSSDEETTDEPPGESSEDSGDETSGGVVAPQIVETIPADGAVGVAEDSTIEIVFSEPMDKVATQAAYQSADLPAAAVTFAWNEAGDRLTITPNELLAYNPAYDLDDPARTYAFTITTAAESEDGVALASDIQVEFSTLRLFLQYFTADAGLSGAVRDLAGVIGSGQLGDSITNDPSRYFVSFDLSGMAPDVVDWAAEMTVTRGAVISGNPFVDLGAVLFQQVQYDALVASTYDTAAIGSGYALFPVATPAQQTVDVASHLGVVLEDPDTYNNRLQFRFVWWPSETDGDGAYDSIAIDEAGSPPRLGVLYLAP